MTRKGWCLLTLFSDSDGVVSFNALNDSDGVVFFNSLDDSDEVLFFNAFGFDRGESLFNDSPSSARATLFEEHTAGKE